MHGLWLEFETRSLEERFLSARAEHLKLRYRIVMYGAVAFRSILVVTASNSGSHFMWLCALFLVVELMVCWGGNRELAGRFEAVMLFASRILDAIFWCWSPSTKYDERGLLRGLSSMTLHIFPLFAQPPFRIVLPSQILVTMVFLLLGGKRACKDGHYLDLEFTKDRLKAMYMVSEPKQDNAPRCLHSYIAIHAMLGWVVVPYVIWCLEFSSRVQFLGSIPDERRPSHSRFHQRIPLVMYVLHIIVMAYGFCMLFQYIGKSPLPRLMDEWGWCAGC